MNIFLTFMVFTLINVKHYKDKIYYIEPVKAEKIEGDFYILFKTGIQADKAFLLENGNIITFKNSIINEYSAAGKLIYSRKLDFETGIIVPSEYGEFVIIGRPNRKQKTYDIIKMYMRTGKMEKVISLDKNYFPCVISPIKRVKETIKEEPSFQDDYFGFVYENGDFSGGKIIENNLYLWFSPEIGLYFGGIYKISLKTDKLTVISDNMSTLCGIGREGISYTVLKDKDASEMEKAIYLKGKKRRKFPFPFLTSKSLYANGIGVTVDKNTLYVFRTPSITPLHKIIIHGDNIQLLKISPSGNRIFLSYEYGGKSMLSLLDIRKGKLEHIAEDSPRSFGNLQCSYDGEAFIFTIKNTLYTGYLNDIYAPFIHAHMPDTTHNDTLKVKIASSDVAFVSQGVKLSFSGKVIKNDTLLTLILTEGDNFFVFRAEDRANNSRNIREHIFYLPKKKKRF